MRIVSRSVERNQRRTFRWPSHARADPFVNLESVSTRRLAMSEDDQVDWVGMVMSSSVMLAATMRPSLRGLPALDTAAMAPNWKGQ